MRTYRELQVWQKSMLLVNRIYDITKKLPKEETYALSDQMRRAVISIPSNVAEGYGRRSDKDFAYFLTIARGSTFEIETQLQVAIMLGYVNEDQVQESFSLCDECTKILNALIKNRS